jgi:AraC-like DNA-binding protein
MNVPPAQRILRMPNTPTVLAMTLTPMQEALQGRGIDFRVLARRVGIDPDLLARPNARYSSARIQKLWQLAATESGDPLFGLHVGGLARPGMLHALGLGIVSSTSVLSALKRIERYSSVVSTNGRFVLTQQDGLVSLETRPTETTVMPTVHSLEAWVATLCRILSLCAGSSAYPLKVRLPHQAAAPADAYRAILRCPVEFGASTVALVFDAQLAARPVLTGNSELAAEADRISARYIEGLAPDSAAARVRALLLKAMPSGEIAQKGIARALSQSASTLQRRLREEGTSYQRLLDGTRQELALDYLKEGRHSLAEIAFLLGFADQSNFTRAFRRWTGKTPRQYLS